MQHLTIWMDPPFIKKRKCTKDPREQDRVYKGLKGVEKVITDLYATTPELHRFNGEFFHRVYDRVGTPPSQVTIGYRVDIANNELSESRWMITGESIDFPAAGQFIQALERKGWTVSASARSTMAEFKGGQQYSEGEIFQRLAVEYFRRQGGTTKSEAPEELEDQLDAA